MSPKVLFYDEKRCKTSKSVKNISL